MNGMEAATAIARSSAYYNENTSEGIFALVASKREFESIEQARKYAQASAYKRASASKQAQALERKRWTLASASDEPMRADIADRMIDVDVQVRVNRAVQSLPRVERDVILMRYFIGMNITEITAAYGTTRATIRYLLARAQARLRDSLQDLQ